MLGTHVAPDSSVFINVTSAPSAVGISNAVLTFVWDSLGNQAVSTVALFATVQSVSAALQVAAPTVTGSGIPSSDVVVPVLITQAPPVGLDAQRAQLTLRYRRDLFALGAITSAYKVESQSVSTDGSGNELVTLMLSSASGFSATELARLNLKVMLALDTTTSIDILDVQFFDASMKDTFCVDVSQQSSSFKPSDICGATDLRTFMGSGSLPLSFESIEPNPGTGAFQLIVNASHSSSAHIEIFNLLGESMLSMDRPTNSGRNSVDLDLNFLSEGSYIVRVSDGFTAISRKLVIRR